MLNLSSFKTLKTFQKIKMHSLDQNTSSVPAFIIKLWKLVEDQDCDDLISWSDKENSFVIRQQATFARDLLPKYFKHNNMASFIRQLNMYGFRKVMNYEKGGLTVDNDEMEFYHPFFLKGSEDLLELIKRKAPTSKGSDLNSNPKDILTDLTVIREKQESMNSILIGMKKENELLWRELSSLRQKHKNQEQIIQKVIHFLVSIVQSSKQNIGVKRKITHMLQDSTATSAKRSRGLVDVVRGKKTDFFFSVSDDDKATSPDGPVIHEVTEFDHEDSVDFEDSLRLSSKSKRGRAETIAHVESPQSSSADVASPADSLELLEPVSSQTSILPYEKVEEVLGLPLEHPAESTISTTTDVSNVISIPEIAAKSLLSPQILDLLISSSDGKSNIISLPEGTQLISVAPDTAGNITITESNSNSNKPQVVYSSSDLSFSPSTVTVVREDVGACGKTPPIVELSDTNSPKFSELERSISSPTIKMEGKLKSCLKSSQNPNSSKMDVFLKVENQENAMQNNFPLSLSDSSSSTELAKNTISNHILDVDQDIDWLHGQLNSGGFDSSMLLELFSSDEAANNAAQTCQLNSDDCILRDTDSNIIGNELVQFTPSILDIDFDDMENPMLMDYLNESTDGIMEDASASSSLKTPPIIKPERIESISSCVFENSMKVNPNPPTPRGRKTSRGRGKRKTK